MKYVFAVIACLLMSVGLVWAGSLTASCGNWTNAWLCRVAERVGGAVLAPGLMTELYSGSRLFVLMSDTLFYAGIFFVIVCLWRQRGSKIAKVPERAAQVDARRITVEMTKGKVILRGELKTWAERDQAERAVRATGVFEIENDIRLLPS